MKAIYFAPNFNVSRRVDFFIPAPGNKMFIPKGVKKIVFKVPFQDNLIDFLFQYFIAMVRGDTNHCCQARSKRSRFITLVHAATKSFTNFP